MKVSEAMTRNCKAIKPSDSLQEAARHMRDDDIGMVMVMEGDQLQGVLTDRDIAVRAVAQGSAPDTQASQCMSKEIISCKEDADLEDAAELMEREQVRRLLVLDQQDRPCGVLAQADLARTLSTSPKLGEVLRDISQPGGKHTQH